MTKKLIISLDYDSCSDILFDEIKSSPYADHADPLYKNQLESFLDKIAEDFDEVELRIGSARQRTFSDSIGDSKNKNGRCFSNFQAFCEKKSREGKKWTFVPRTLGTEPRPDKIDLIEDQLADAAKRNPDDKIYFYFFDNLEQKILHPLKNHFNVNKTIAHESDAELHLIKFDWWNGLRANYKILEEIAHITLKSTLNSQFIEQLILRNKFDYLIQKYRENPNIVEHLSITTVYELLAIFHNKHEYALINTTLTIKPIPVNLLFQKAVLDDNFPLAEYLLTLPEKLSTYGTIDLEKILTHLIFFNQNELTYRCLESQSSNDKHHFTKPTQTALHLCMMMGNPDTQLILKICSNYSNLAIPDEKNETPLSLAAKNNHFDLIKQMCRAYPHMIEDYSLRQLLVILDILHIQKQYDLFNFIIKNAPNHLHEYLVENKLFNFDKIITKNSMITALNALEEKDINVKRLTVFLNQFLLLQENWRLNNPAFYADRKSIKDAIVKKILACIINNKPIDITSFEISILISTNDKVLKKIFDTFSSIEPIAGLKKTISIYAKPATHSTGTSIKFY